MIKITPNVNLLPCTRERYVAGAPYNDLIFNYLQAKKLIRIANQYFFLKNGAGVFSGYIDEFQDGLFSLKLWIEGKEVRTVVLYNLGYSGKLHVEVENREDLDFDSLGAASWREDNPATVIVR